MPGTPFTPPRVAVLTSHSASGIERLLGDPQRGSLYDLVAILGSESRIAEQEAIDAAGVPTILRPIRPFHAERHLPLRSLRGRGEYDAATADVLRRLDVDYVLLAGYHYIVTEPLLAEFPQRMVALHDGDLTRVDEDGRRSYGGLHAVRNAILDGAGETRCSAFFVTREVAAGPLFLLSGSYPVSPLVRDARSWGDTSLLQAYADVHGAWMRRSAWGEMLARSTQLLAAGTVQLVGDVAWVDGVPGPCRMGEAPSVCYERESATPSGIPASCPFISG